MKDDPRRAIHGMFADDDRDAEPSPTEELNSFLCHYGFTPMGDSWLDVEKIVALLGHMEHVLTLPSQTRTAKTPHPLYPEED